MVSYHFTKFCLFILREIVYCCFTRTTLFTRMFTIIILVCSLKTICIYTKFCLDWLLCK